MKVMTRLLTAALLGVALSAQAGAQAPDPAALFDRGVGFDQFLSGVSARRELWQNNARRAAPGAAQVARLKSAGSGLQILAIAEGACSDSVSTVPYLAAAAAQAGVPLRIVGRDAGRAIMEQHRTPDNRAATPTVVLLRNGRPAGVWVERPESLQRWYLSPDGTALAADDRQARKMSWYDWDRGDSTVAEIVALAERSVASGGFSRR